MILFFSAVLSLQQGIIYKMLTAEAPLRMLTLKNEKVRLIDTKNIKDDDSDKFVTFSLRFKGDFNEGSLIQINFIPNIYLCRENKHSTSVNICKQKGDLTTWKIVGLEKDTFMIKQDNKCLFVDKYDEEAKGNLVELVRCNFNDIKQKFKILPAGKNKTIDETNDAGSQENFLKQKEESESDSESDSDEESSASKDDLIYNKTKIGGNFEAGNKEGTKAKPKITVGLGGLNDTYKDDQIPVIIV
ncbi:hypothetical protein BDAP_000241 [Binucleata daphniae]